MLVGLQITKNKQKYKKLISLIDKSQFKRIKFIHIEDEKTLIKQFSKLNILVTYQITPALFSYRSNNLKWIHIGASGVEDNLFNEILQSKVMITNAKGINSKHVAEFIISRIMYFAKIFNECNKFKINKIWNQWELAKKTFLLSDSTLGIIGYGEVGKELSKLAKTFGMRVLATRRLQKKVEHKKFVDSLLPTSHINTIFKESDYLVIACPLTPLTKGSINKKIFKMMKKKGILINISRGSIVNEKDLINALLKKQISGAALDVFLNEPLDKKNRLFNIDNVLLSPHISGNFSKYQEVMILQFSDMLIKFINNKTLKNRVCKKRLY